MTKETRDRIAKLYKEGKWNKKDLVAKSLAENIKDKPAQEEEKEKVKKKKGR